MKEKLKVYSRECTPNIQSLSKDSKSMTKVKGIFAKEYQSKN